ncbi:hypothetical protein [Frondihabitans sp. PAMC 28766]|uniref:hypothetical protein n=1 Tax=Frondihabitans sp. PAMC 28766 TaxID=1795630 RepID=UPI001EF6373D|nr:hypothetical protein [Frondihabitans sp. PAMC 28766]
MTATGPQAPGSRSSAAGTGVRGMTQRLAAIGGSLEAEAVDGTFTARARIPTPRSHQEAP